MTSSAMSSRRIGRSWATWTIYKRLCISRFVHTRCTLAVAKFFNAAFLSRPWTLMFTMLRLVFHRLRAWSFFVVARLLWVADECVCHYCHHSFSWTRSVVRVCPPQHNFARKEMWPALSILMKSHSWCPGRLLILFYLVGWSPALLRLRFRFDHLLFRLDVHHVEIFVSPTLNVVVFCCCTPFDECVCHYCHHSLSWARSVVRVCRLQHSFARKEMWPSLSILLKSNAWCHDRLLILSYLVGKNICFVFYIIPVETFHCKLPGRATRCFCCVAHRYKPHPHTLLNICKSWQHSKVFPGGPPP